MQQLSINATTDNASALRSSAGGICILAVPPSAVYTVASQCGSELNRMRLVISVVAGVSINMLRRVVSLLFAACLYVYQRAF